GLRREPGPADDEEAIAWLLRGDLDAVITTTGPRYWSLFGGDRLDEICRSHPEVRPLIDDPATIADAYRRTGLYPITDVVVLRPGTGRGTPGAARWPGSGIRRGESPGLGLSRRGRTGASGPRDRAAGQRSASIRARRKPAPEPANVDRLL